MWSKLGTCVDINLDSLTPYSKGQKSQPGNNVPLNAMMSQTSPIRHPMISPTSTNYNPRLTTPPPPQISPITGVNNQNMFFQSMNRK
jgi:hypothetical protein